MRPARRGAVLFSAFSAGVFWCVYLLSPGLWLKLGLALLIPAGLFLWRRVGAGVLICLGAAAALLWCGCFRAVFFSSAEGLDGRRSRVTAVLSEEVSVNRYGKTYVPCWVVREGKVPIRGTLYAGEELAAYGPGDRVSALCDCTKTAFQEETRFTSAATWGAFLTLEVKSALTVERADSVPWWCVPRWWGQRLSASINAVFPGDVSGFLAALVTGDKGGIDGALTSDLARSGASHIVAVSGMHVCFLMSFLTLFTGYEPRRRAFVCLPVLVFFALAVGGMPSVLRACLFQFALLTADLLGREEDRWTTLTAALALLLLLDPFSAANIGLQLSFAAVAGIAWLTPRVYTALDGLRLAGEGEWTRRLNWFISCGCELFAASMGAMVFTAPLSAYYFGSFSLLAPLTNILVLPVASVLFAGTLVTGLWGIAFPAAARIAAQLPALLGRYVLWVIRTVARIPYCSVRLDGDTYAVALAGLYVLAALALFRPGHRRRRWPFAACGAAVLAGSILFADLSLLGAGLTLTVLDVGQGQSVVMTSKGETAVVDCGGNSRADPGDLCADYLTDRGIRRVDKLILTHCHADHANGLDALFRRLDVAEVILPRTEHDEDAQLQILALAKAEGAKVTWLSEDTELTLGGARLRLYAPLGGGNENEDCAAVVVCRGKTAALLTGDMDAKAEARLTAHAELGRCQVLIAGHHGSASSSGDVLLNAVRPETAIISVGENTYGHPEAETLDRLARYGAEIYRTDALGAVTVRID